MPPLSFSILGPLEVRSGDTVVPITGKPATVLATLLLHLREVVSAETLIDALWGEDPPETARAALQVHVSKLRKILASAGDDDLVTTRGSGYALDIEPERLDLTRFERSVHEARAALGDGDAARARSLMTEALDSRRGRPLEGLDAPDLVATAIVGIEDLLREAVVLGCEADLALGRHREAIPELEALCAKHPLDEHIVELTALALYRSGRQGEAVQRIGALRRALSEELGMDPGPGIVALEAGILGSDPALAGPTEADEPVAGEHRKTVTALVCRLGSGDGDLEARRRALDEFAHVAAEIATPLEGDVLGTGGRVVVTFGVRSMHEDDAVRATKAAVAIMDEAVRSRRPVAIGVASGEALVESAGARKELRTTDPLDDAERLATAARPGEILLGLAAFRLARDAVEVEPDRVVLDDGGETAHRVVGLTDERPRIGRASFVGREDELDTLRRAFDRTSRDRATSLVTVFGPAGIGKSRLVVAFLDRLPDGVRSVVGRCLPYGRDITFWPVAEVIREAAGITPDDSARRARAKLAELLAADDDVAYLAAQVEVVLGLSDASPAPDELHWAIRRCFELAAAGGPFVIVWDDLQFADDALLDLLGYLAVSTRDAPILLIAVARPELLERRTGWADRAGAIDLHLQPLDAGSATEFLHLLTGGAPIDAEPLARIAEVGEGNPLFLGELLAMLVDEGRIVREHGRWRSVSELASIDLPPSVHQLLAARLDVLPADELAVLDAAAVIGEEFSEADVAALRSDLEGGDVTEILGRLERRDLVSLDRFTRGTGRVFRFRHLMLRDAVYRGVPKEARARDHERFGTILEENAGERLPEIEEIVGYHVETALGLWRELGAPAERLDDLGRRAAERLASAGRRAVMRDDLAAAAALFGRALASLPPEDPDRVGLWWRRGMTLTEIGRFAEADEALRSGLAEAARAGDDPGRWRLLVEVENLRWYRAMEDGSLAAIRDTATRAIEELSGVEDHAGLARAERLLYDALITEGKQTAAMEAVRRGAAHAAVAGELWDRSTAGMLHGPAPVDALIEDARRHLASNASKRPETTSKVGACLALKGDVEGARAHLAEGVALARDIGVELRVADALMMTGYASTYLADPAPGEAALVEAISILESLGESAMRSTSYALLADVLLRLDRPGEALRATEAAERLGADDDLATQTTWRRVRARLLAGEGNLDEAIALAGSAVSLVDDTECLPMAAEAHADLAEVLLLAGRDDEAEIEARRAIERFEAKGATAGVADVRARLGML